MASKVQIDLINSLLVQYFLECPNGKASVVAELDLQDEQYNNSTPIYDAVGRKRFQTLLAICYSSARHAQTELHELVSDIKQDLWKLEKQIGRAQGKDGPQLANNKAERLEMIRAGLAQLLEAQIGAEFWNKTWTRFQEHFQDLFEQHLKWIETLFGLDTTNFGEGATRSLNEQPIMDMDRSRLKFQACRYGMSQKLSIDNLRQSLLARVKQIEDNTKARVELCRVDDNATKLQAKLESKYIAHHGEKDVLKLQELLLEQRHKERLAHIDQIGNDKKVIAEESQIMGYSIHVKPEVQVQALKSYEMFVHDAAFSTMANTWINRLASLTVEEYDVETSEIRNKMPNASNWHERALAYVNVTVQYTRCLHSLSPLPPYDEDKYKSLKGYFAKINL